MSVIVKSSWPEMSVIVTSGTKGRCLFPVSVVLSRWELLTPPCIGHQHILGYMYIPAYAGTQFELGELRQFAKSKILRWKEWLIKHCNYRLLFFVYFLGLVVRNIKLLMLVINFMIGWKHSWFINIYCTYHCCLMQIPLSIIYNVPN